MKCKYCNDEEKDIDDFSTNDFGVSKLKCKECCKIDSHLYYIGKKKRKYKVSDIKKVIEENKKINYTA